MLRKRKNVDMNNQSLPYEVEDSTENALAMLGSGYSSVEISPSEKRLVRIDGEFREVEKAATVTISTAFKKEMENVSGDALKVWLYISLSINKTTERANPGLRTIAKACHLAVNTVQKCLSELEKMNLLLVNRETARYNIYEVPLYVSANRKPPAVSQNDTVEQTVSNSPETVSNSEQTVSPAVILNHLTSINHIDDSKFPLEWQILSGKEVTPELQQASLLSEEAIRTFEKELGFGILSWEQNNEWVAFRKFVEKVYAKDKGVWGDYAKWREGDGKYGKAMTNNAIRKNPKMFIDTGYPTYEASKMYRKEPEYKKVVADEDDEKGVPNPFGRPKGLRPVVRPDRAGSQSTVE